MNEATSCKSQGSWRGAVERMGGSHIKVTNRTAAKLADIFDEYS